MILIGCYYFKCLKAHEYEKHTSFARNKPAWNSCLEYYLPAHELTMHTHTYAYTLQVGICYNNSVVLCLI